MPSAIYHAPQSSLFTGVCICGKPIADHQAVEYVDPLRARARSTDPETSHEAAASVDRIRASQQEILVLFRKYGAMTDEVARDRYTGKQSASGFRTRRSELVAQGLLVDSGFRQQSASGRKMIVWATTTWRATAAEAL